MMMKTSGYEKISLSLSQGVKVLWFIKYVKDDGSTEYQEIVSYL